MIIAITGGIGSGKSMVRRIVEALGGYTIDADMVNKELMTKTHYINEIRKMFPKAVSNNVINKKKLAEIVFNDKDSLIKLNALAHPLIMGLIMYEANEIKVKNVFVELSLLTDNTYINSFDRIWYVESDYQLRRERALKRTNVDKELLDKIIKAQEKEINIKAIASDIITNNGSEVELWEKVQKLYLSL